MGLAGWVQRAACVEDEVRSCQNWRRLQPAQSQERTRLDRARERPEGNPVAAQARILRED